MKDIVNLDSTTGMGSDSDIALGQWYWVKETARWANDGKSGLKSGDTYEWTPPTEGMSAENMELRQSRMI